MAEGGRDCENDSENEDCLEDVRRKRIQELVRSIARTKKQKKQKLIGKDTHMENPKKRPRGNGRHPIMKLQIGWLHQTRGKYRQVTARRGGGTRIYEFNRDDEQTVETVTNYAKRIFFPDGKNDMGELADMEVKLSSFNGEAIEKFTGNDGNECCLQDYLKTIGVFSSQYYLYLRTSKKPPIDVLPSEESISEDSFSAGTITSLTVNGQTPGEICIHYTKTCHSLYTEELSQKTCFTIDDCFLDTCVYDPDTERKKYNPLENDFKVTGLTVNQISLLRPSDNNSNKFEYPTATLNSTGVIHTPDQVMGFEKSKNKQLLLGVLYKEHNSGAYFQWYMNKEAFASGIDLCIIPVSEPGEYVVNVCHQETVFECRPVSVEAQCLLTDNPSTSNNSQVFQQSTAGLTMTTECFQTDNSSNYIQAIPQNTTVFTSQGLPTIDLSGSNSIQTTSWNTTGLTNQSSSTNISGANNDQIILQDIALSSNQGLLTDSLIASNFSQTIPQTMTEYTTECLLTDNISASNYSQAFLPNTTGLINQVDDLGASNSSQVIEQTTSEVTKQDLITDNASKCNSSQVIEQTTSELTNQELITDNVSTCNSSQVVGQTTSELTNQELITDNVSTCNSSQVAEQTTSELTNQELITDNVSTCNSSQVAEQTTSELTNQELITDNVSTCNSSQVIEQTTSELKKQDLLTDNVSTGNSSQTVVQSPTALRNQVLSSDDLSSSYVSQAIPKKTKGSINQDLPTKELRTSNYDQASPQNISVLTNQGLTSDKLRSSNFCRATSLNLSTDSNVPEIPFESLKMGPKIGEGNFGTVHKAHWHFTPVAVKTVKIRRMKLVQKALAREVKVLSRVRHPHIILFMAYSINNNALHIVSEYIQGSDLDDLLFGNKCQRIPLPEKCRIAEKISLAVTYLHNCFPTILHRDIKPENIILTHTFETVKLCDLGISKLLTINSSATTYAEGMQPGTPIFQAPEILLGNTPASTKSDVWGMAGTLVELFSETPLWDLQDEDEEETECSTVEMIKNFMCQNKVPHAIERLSKIDSIPKIVANILTKGLNYDPDSRPASIEFPTEFNI